jgi:FRG domain
MQVLLELQGKRWLSRGQPQPYKNLIPSIDRCPGSLTRLEKLQLERESIDVFRTTARFFVDEGERNAVSNDLTALMVLRHYGVRTRLLDWSISPHVAAYFAVCDHDGSEGELWTFDHDEYAKEGREQWKRWPETTRGATGNPDDLDYSFPAAFTLEEPNPWFVCVFYALEFHRQRVQHAFWSLTPQFGKCHGEAVLELLDESKCCRYEIEPALKPELRKILRERHGIWRGSLFPDSAGAAATAGMIFGSRTV